MKVLILNYSYLTGHNGAANGSRTWINAFAEICDEVDVLSPYKNGLPPEEISPKANIIEIKEYRNKIRKGIDFYLRGITHRFESCFKYFFNQKHYDLVVFSGSHCVRNIISYVIQKNVKTITIHHNFEYEYTKDNCNKLLRPLILHWIKKSEGEAVRQSDINIVLTEDDKKLLKKVYSPNNEISIVNLGSFEYKHNDYHVNPKKSNNVFVITGSLSTVQMKKSLYPWLHEYYPLLQREIPKTKLIIAGRSPEKYLVDFCLMHNIELIASPQNMEPILERANYYICPVCLGGGIKLRIMDGLKSGLQILTHEVSARGYDYFLEDCLYAYHDKDSFMKGLHSMIGKDTNPNRIVEKYEEYFSFESGVERLRILLNKYHYK